MGITITEALSELNLVKKKIETKRNTIGQNLCRYEHLNDPFASAGGSKKKIHEEKQSLTDLNKRFVTLRAKIADANLKNTITLNGDTRTIFEWITWKREISKDEIGFLSQCTKTIKHELDSDMKNPKLYKGPDDLPKMTKVEVNLDYSETLTEYEKLADTLEKLDGQLSLKNATIVIDV